MQDSTHPYYAQSLICLRLSPLYLYSMKPKGLLKCANRFHSVMLSRPLYSQSWMSGRTASLNLGSSVFWRDFGQVYGKGEFFLIECTTSQWEWYWKRKTYRFSCFIVAQINIFKIPHRKFCKIVLIENRNRCYLDFLLSGVNGFFSFVQTSSSKLW